MMRKVLIATRNPNKVRELQQLLSSVIECVALPEEAPEVDEDGSSFYENASKKAREYSRLTHLPTIAEDSGLEVDALNGAPGVFSARFAGPLADAGANNRHLLERLRGISSEDRTARFVCCMIYREGDSEHEFRGEVRGRIAPQLSGTSGFGYDPLFIPEGYTQTFAEMTAELKNSMSHRYQAIRQLTAFLKHRG